MSACFNVSQERFVVRQFAPHLSGGFYHEDDRNQNFDCKQTIIY